MVGRLINVGLESSLIEGDEDCSSFWPKLDPGSSQYKSAALQLYHSAWLQLELHTVMGFGKMCKLF
jgi:hypothetical protein